MSHSIWHVDILIFVVNDLETSKMEPAMEQRLKTVVEMSCKTLEWLEEAGKVLKFSFLVEFSTLSFIYCMEFVIIASNFELRDASFVLDITEMMAQLFVYCRMGSRLIVRIEKLIDAVYATSWYTMRPSQRKDVLKILMMTQ